LYERIELITSPRGDGSRVCDEAREIGFEGTLVDVTLAVVLTRNLGHDVVLEENVNSIHYTLNTATPFVVLSLFIIST
jgi:hypothetical protein